MEILKYYDDDVIEEEAVFFSNKKIVFFIILSLLLAIFSLLRLDYFFRRELINKFIIVIYSIFTGISLTSFLFFLLLIIFRAENNQNCYSKHELTIAKEKYEHKRKKILEQHKYNFSICNEWDNEEYMVDSFYVNLNGMAFINNSDSDYCLNKDVRKIYYHHIIDNRDGHILTVKELKEKYLSENINGKSPKNNKSESREEK